FVEIVDKNQLIFEFYYALYILKSRKDLFRPNHILWRALNHAGDGICQKCNSPSGCVGYDELIAQVYFSLWQEKPLASIDYWNNLPLNIDDSYDDIWRLRHRSDFRSRKDSFNHS